MNARRSLAWMLLASALAATACSSGGSTPAQAPSSHSAAPSATASPSAAATPSASAAPSGSSEPTSGAAAEQAITANWTAFFDPKTSAAQKAILVQNGPQFAAVLAAPNSQGAAASAKVIKVTVTSSSQAAVTYDILLSGTPVLSNQKGTAVYQDGTWKVGDASFCGLLTLEAGGKTSSLPAACKSAA
jgi:hypothetical protein